jgi:SAM-dependent methyltransferase
MANLDKGDSIMLKNKTIDHGKEFDWGNTSKDYAKFRDIYPDDFYKRIIDLGICTAGQTALDLGTGTGVLPRNMYRFGAEWTGTDISENQIAEGVRLASESGMNIRFFAAPAEKTGLPDKTFDVITACQCFMYFDKATVLPEIVRMLKPDGRFLILFMSWLPFENEIAMKSEHLVLKYNPSWTGASFKRFEPAVPEWSKNLFDCVNCTSYETGVTFTRESWHGRIIACRGIGASSLPQSEIEGFKKEHFEYMQTVPESFTIPHFVTMLNLKPKIL